MSYRPWSKPTLKGVPKEVREVVESMWTKSDIIAELMELRGVSLPVIESVTRYVKALEKRVRELEGGGYQEDSPVSLNAQRGLLDAVFSKAGARVGLAAYRDAAHKGHSITVMTWDGKEIKLTAEKIPAGSRDLF